MNEKPATTVVGKSLFSIEMHNVEHFVVLSAAVTPYNIKHNEASKIIFKTSNHYPPYL